MVLKSAVTVIAAGDSCVLHQQSCVCLDFYVKVQPLYTHRNSSTMCELKGVST